MGFHITGRDKSIGAALRGVRLFADWPIAPMQQLKDAAELWSYDAGETIQNRGGAPAGVWAVAVGSARSFRQSPHGYLLQGVHWPGDVFGLTAALDGGPSPLSHAARTDAVLVFVPRPALDAIRRSNTEVANSITNFICARTRIDFEALFMISCEPLRTRVAKWLAYVPGRSLLLSDEPADSPGWKDAAPVELTQDEIGAILGVARQTLNRTIMSFIHDGIVRREGNSIHVVDFRGLLAVLEEHEPLPDIWRAQVLSWDARRRQEERAMLGGIDKKYAQHPSIQAD